MPSEFSIKRRVDFADTDLAGIVHFSNYFRYVESAEHAFFRSLGLSIIMDIEGRKVTWPRVFCNFEYKKPIRFEQEVEIRLTIEEMTEKSITYCARICYEGEIMATGRMKIVCCSHDHEKGLKSIPIPAIIREKIQPKQD